MATISTNLNHLLWQQRKVWRGIEGGRQTGWLCRSTIGCRQQQKVTEEEHEARTLRNFADEKKINVKLPKSVLNCLIKAFF